MKNLPDLASKPIENTLGGSLITDNNGTILFANNVFLQIAGYSLEEVLGKTPGILKSGIHDTEFYKKMWYELERNGSWKGEVWNMRKNGEIYPQKLTITKLEDSACEGKIYYASILHDLTEAKQHEDAWRYRAYHEERCQAGWGTVHEMWTNNCRLQYRVGCNAGRESSQ